jgi:pentatricopeptide repeat protein
MDEYRPVLVEALARAGRLEEARMVLEKMFTCANHVGLYAGEIGATGRRLETSPSIYPSLAHQRLVQHGLGVKRDAAWVGSSFSIGHSVLHIEWCFFEVGLKGLPNCIAHAAWLWLGECVIDPHDPLACLFIQSL